MEFDIDRSLRHWWVFIIRGILFILLGIYMIGSPATSYMALGFLFGLIIFMTGVVELLHVSRSRRAGNRNWHLVLGIIDIILGIVLIGHIAASAAILRVIVGIWFLFRGISLLSFSTWAGSSWVLVLGGIITSIFGLLIIFNAGFGFITIILFTAIAFIIAGIFNVWLGYNLKP